MADLIRACKSSLSLPKSSPHAMLAFSQHGGQTSYMSVLTDSRDCS